MAEKRIYLDDPKQMPDVVLDIFQGSGLTKTQFCQEAEIDNAQMNKWLAGKQGLHAASLYRLARAGGYRVALIKEEKDDA